MEAGSEELMNSPALEMAGAEDKVRHQIWAFMMKQQDLLTAFVDKQLKFTVVNQALAKAVGQTPGAIYGRPFSDLFPQPEAIKIMHLADRGTQAIVDDGRSWPWPGIKKSNYRYWDWIVQPLSNGRQRRQGFMLIWREATKRKKSDLDKERTGLKVQQDRRMKDINKLAAIIAHELRNPLAVILAAVYNVRRHQSSPEIADHLDRINKKVAESQQIINNILLFANLKQPAFKRVPVEILLNEALESFQQAVSGQKISIRKRYLNLSGQKIHADPLQFREVITNVLRNAFQAVNGLTHPSIRLQASMDKKKTLTVRIQDNGPGIKDALPEKLMEPFFTQKAKGTGLGLAICKQIMDLHCGTLDIANHPRGGAVVTFKLFGRP